MSGNSSMMPVVLIGGVGCLCLVSSAAAGIAWYTGVFDGLFGTASPKAGQWVCPDLPPGVTEPYNLVQDANSLWWCRHPNTAKSTVPTVVNYSRASQLPSKAKAGTKYDRNTLSTTDGSDGVYGPGLTKSYGYNLDHGPLYYTAPA